MTTIVLMAYRQLTVTAHAMAAATLVRLGDTAGDAAQLVTPISAGTSTVVGPFAGPTRWDIVSPSNCLASYSSAAVDFPTLEETEATLPTVIPITGTVGDVVEMIASGAPVNGTTGATVAGKGSRYTNIATGTLYINTGTKAVPAWTALAAAA